MTTTQDVIKADSDKAATYTLIVVFTVEGNAHRSLRHQQAIRDEAQSFAGEPRRHRRGRVRATGRVALAQCVGATSLAREPPRAPVSRLP